MTIETTNPPWTAAVCARLIELKAATNSLQKISETLNEEFNLMLTRNAVSGRLHRMGLSIPKPISEPPAAQLPIPLPAVAIEPDLPPMSIPDGKTIYQLRALDCRWPLGNVTDRPPYFYCGSQIMPGFPYCPEHCAQAYPGF